MYKVKLIDCTLRDGGYYNVWDFNTQLIKEYLQAMSAISVDYVELGFRSFDSNGFKGGCAYTTDNFISQFDIPDNLKIGVMVNASELVKHPDGVLDALSHLFKPASKSPVTLVRIACHFHEFAAVLPGCQWLKEQGYVVGINLMQIADRSAKEITDVAHLANQCPPDVLYFADSMGSMNPEHTAEIIHILQTVWQGELGIHTHDNMGQALANSLRAVQENVSWVDGTVTGMGRGAGNVKIEYLAIELAPIRQNCPCNITPLMTVIRKYFSLMQKQYGWGTNSYYYLAGKYAIHPTYIQEMLTDARYIEEDILAVIDHLKSVGGKRFNLNTLEAARHFYVGEPRGKWTPASLIAGREVLILGTGPGVAHHQQAIEDYIRDQRPCVIALNTQIHIAPELIEIRAACHPVRLLADCAEHGTLPQPLVTPASMLPDTVLDALEGKKLLDFGLAVEVDTFRFENNYCILPTSLVIAYALAIATSGQASRIFLAGFDGYGADDLRNNEMDALLKQYIHAPGAVPLTAVTPTRYQIPQTSVYSFVL
ncbi:MAG: aldolase catalytic domain-containing protein [Dolichospermum sp.]